MKKPALLAAGLSLIGLLFLLAPDKSPLGTWRSPEGQLIRIEEQCVRLRGRSYPYEADSQGHFVLDGPFGPIQGSWRLEGEELLLDTLGQQIRLKRWKAGS